MLLSHVVITSIIKNVNQNLVYYLNVYKKNIFVIGHNTIFNRNKFFFNERMNLKSRSRVAVSEDEPRRVMNVLPQFGLLENASAVVSSAAVLSEIIAQYL